MRWWCAPPAWGRGRRSIAPEGNAAAWSDDLPLVAGGDHLWLAAHGSGDDGAAVVVKLFHADWLTPDGAEPVAAGGGGWEAVVELNGALAGRGAAGMAASGDRLWLLFRNGPVQAIRLEPGPLPGDWRYLAANAASLPRGGGAEVVAAATGGSGERLWVLMRGNSASAFEEWDAAASPDTGATPAGWRGRSVARPGPTGAMEPGAAPAPQLRPRQAEGDEAAGRCVAGHPAAGCGRGDAARLARQCHADQSTPPTYRLAALEGAAWTGFALPDGFAPDPAATLVAPAEARRPAHAHHPSRPRFAPAAGGFSARRRGRLDTLGGGPEPTR